MSNTLENESNYNEDDLYDMDDDALEAAFKEAKAAEANSDIVEGETPNTEIVDMEEEDVDEISEDLEQSDKQDSDDDIEDDDESEEVDDENSEDEDDKSNENIEDTDEKNSDDTTKDTDKLQPTQKSKFKADGVEYEFTDDEIKEKFPQVFAQAMNYTKKMQKIKPWRKTIDAIEQAQLSQDDINLAIDVLKGDKGAIGELLKRTGVDALDLDTEDNNYVPNDYGRDEQALDLKDVIDDISADPEYTLTQKVLTNDWDDTSWNVMSKDPQMIKALHTDIKSGMFNKVQPIAAKLKVYDGGRKTDLDYYKEAAVAYFAEQNTANPVMDTRAEDQQVAKEQEVQRVKNEELARKSKVQKANKRKSAAPTKNSAGTNGGKVDYLSDSDEDFEKWYASLQDKY